MWLCAEQGVGLNDHSWSHVRVCRKRKPLLACYCTGAAFLSKCILWWESMSHLVRMEFFVVTVSCYPFQLPSDLSIWTLNSHRNCFTIKQASSGVQIVIWLLRILSDFLIHWQCQFSILSFLYTFVCAVFYWTACSLPYGFCTVKGCVGTFYGISIPPRKSEAATYYRFEEWTNSTLSALVQHLAFREHSCNEGLLFEMMI